MNTQEMKGNWGQVKGKVKEHWGQLTDDELDEVEGNFDQLVGLVQQKTGQAREKIEEVLNSFSASGGRMGQAADAARQYANQAADKAREYADQASEQFHGMSEQARERMMHGYESAHEIIRSRPAEAVAVAFGTGLVLGVIVGMIATSRD